MRSLGAILKVCRTAKIRSVKACFDNAAKEAKRLKLRIARLRRAAKANFSTPLFKQPLRKLIPDKIFPFRISYNDLITLWPYYRIVTMKASGICDLLSRKESSEIACTLNKNNNMDRLRNNLENLAKV